MKSGFEPGLTREVTITVTEDMCPAFDGVVIHRVYSTWSVAHHFEVAARKVLVDFLEPDEEAVGAKLDVEHHAPCPVGRAVRVRAELAEVSVGHHPRVVCRLAAFDGDRLLATGSQTQVVMKRNHLKRYLDRS